MNRAGDRVQATPVARTPLGVIVAQRFSIDGGQREAWGNDLAVMPSQIPEIKVIPGDGIELKYN